MMMAAKKNEVKRGKICPKCGKLVGARSAECECGHVFEVKTKTRGGKAASPSDKLKAASSVINTIKELGGLAKVKAAIENAKKAEAALEKLGGVEAAENAVKVVEELKSL